MLFLRAFACAGEGLPSSLHYLCYHAVSSTPEGSSMLLSKFFTSSMAFAHLPGARLPLAPLRAQYLTTRQNSLYVTAWQLARSCFKILLSIRFCYGDLSSCRYPSCGAPWCLPRLNFHQLDNACLSGHATKVLSPCPTRVPRVPWIQLIDKVTTCQHIAGKRWPFGLS